MCHGSTANCHSWRLPGHLLQGGMLSGRERLCVLALQLPASSHGRGCPALCSPPLCSLGCTRWSRADGAYRARSSPSACRIGDPLTTCRVWKQPQHNWVQSHETVAWFSLGINMVPIGASSPPAKHRDFQQGPQFIFQDGVGRRHLLLAGAEGTVGMMPHHAAHGENTHFY